jgi:hypothetical protein
MILFGAWYLRFFTPFIRLTLFISKGSKSIKCSRLSYSILYYKPINTVYLIAFTLRTQKKPAQEKWRPEKLRGSRVFRNLRKGVSAACGKFVSSCAFRNLRNGFPRLTENLPCHSHFFLLYTRINTTTLAPVYTPVRPTNTKSIRPSLKNSFRSL